MSRFKFGDKVEHKKYGFGVVTVVDGVFIKVEYPDGKHDWCDESESSPYTPYTPAGTVPVRIAVAVNRKGEYRSSGSNGASDYDKSRWAADLLDDDCEIVFVNAHVPLPQPPAEVAAHAVEVQSEQDHH